MYRAGKIKNLKLQETFTLQNAFTTPEGERIPAITYKADFTYDSGNGTVIEDVKGMKTDVYKLKFKMMAAKGLKIVEV